jgi:hypothetical protein
VEIPQSEYFGRCARFSCVVLFVPLPQLKNSKNSQRPTLSLSHSSAYVGSRWLSTSAGGSEASKTKCSIVRADLYISHILTIQNWSPLQGCTVNFPRFWKFKRRGVESLSSEYVFLNFYGAQESISRIRFR